MCDGIGGTESMVAGLVECLDTSVIVSDVATLSGYGPVAERLGGANIRVRSLGRDASPGVVYGRLARLVGLGRYDIVCAYGFKATVIARLAVRGVSRRTRFVCGVRGLHVTEVERLDEPKARVALALERLGASLVDIYDSNSPGALELLASAGVPRAKLRYIPNGLNLTSWEASELPDTDEPVILCVARFVARKRHLDLVQAAEQLVARGIGLRLVFVGDGPTLPAIQATVRDGPAAGLVEFRGPLGADAVRTELRRADICCLPSQWEGMANSVMESMAVGLPVVGTDVNGIADLVIHMETGLLVEPANPTALADALATLIGDIAMRRRFGAAGRKRVESEFTMDTVVAAKTSLYRELADQVS
jgi:glycosyltransferase involved in cell wall biosynthesis